MLGFGEPDMSLNYDLTDCDASLDLMNAKNHTATAAIIWGCMVTGIGHLKDDETCIRWWIRYTAWCTALSVRSISLEAVRARMGLRTNADRRTPTQMMKVIEDVAICEHRLEAMKDTSR